MSLKVKSNGINFNVPTIEDLPTERLEEDLVCVVTDENRGGVFVYREANALVNNGGTIFNGWTRQYDGVVNVKWFGAVGNGVTDDTTAIRNAISTVSISNYNELDFEANKTYIVAPLIPKDYVYIDLNNSTLKLKDSANGPIFFDNGTSTANREFKVINGTLDCNQSNNNGINVLGGIWLTNWTNVTFNNLLIKNCPRIGINLIGCSYVEVSNYRFEDSGITGSSYFAYALNVEKHTYNSDFIRLNNIQVSNVVGYGIHLYGCSYVSGANFTFYNLNYGTSSIAITFTRTRICKLSNIYTNIVTGDAIEINETEDVMLENLKIISSGNRALLVGRNTDNTIYNNKLVIKDFEDLNTGGAASCVLSYCNNSSFENFKIVKGISSGTLATGTKNNSIINCETSTALSASSTILSSKRYVIKNLICSDYTVSYATTYKIEVSVKLSFAINEVKSLSLYDIFYSEMNSNNIIFGEAKIVNIFPSSYTQNSFQTFNFNANNLGTAVNLSTISTLNGVTGRSLTIAGDATNKALTLTNNSGVGLNSYITLEAYKV